MIVFAFLKRIYSTVWSKFTSKINKLFKFLISLVYSNLPSVKLGSGAKPILMMCLLPYLIFLTLFICLKVAKPIILVFCYINRIEWTDLSSICEDHTLKRLREVAIDGHLKVSKFRSVCWALLLDVLSGNCKSWVIQKRMDRSK